ncbi:glycosyltransferase [Falsiroseomonas sp. HW251]|uniref:glycosyltransferase n=1 Tax=Falsiroseomonas sp. HW251 TaxID=3390998 RepID=UPI003D31FB5E
MSLRSLARRLPVSLKAPIGRFIRRSSILSRLVFGPEPEAVDIARMIFDAQQAELSAEDAQRLIAGFAERPLMSVIMPVYKTPPVWLRRAVESLQEQFYGNWELCAVDDCSPTEEQRVLLAELAAADPRVRFEVMERNGGISAASNAALRMARGAFVALLDHDDELTPDALFRMVEAINGHDDVDFVYSDECKLDTSPERRLFDFVLKPGWSPEIMFNGMVTGHLTVYRKSLVDQLGGFRSTYDFSQDYDLALRASEVARRIVHVERVLYLWRSIPGSAAAGGKDFARETNVAALADAVRRRGIPGTALALPHANGVRVELPAVPPRVSIVVPSDSHANLDKVLRSIRDGTGYSDYEVVVVCNGPLAARLEREFQGWAPLRCVHYDKPYNFSDKCNEGAWAASGEILVFYNDDVFPLQRDWIERLIEYLWVPGVGGVSPKLLYPDDTIQYAGMISGTPGLCGTAYNHVPTDHRDAFLSMHLYVRNVSILSGACCALRKDLFRRIGGFDAVNTADGHSDMDLSYKLIEAGLRCVYTPHAVLRHIGNHSWGAKTRKYKADIFVLKRWGALVSSDPFFTESMKQALYTDFRFRYRIHAEHVDPRAVYAGPDVLLVSHELTLTGAPRMLFYAARVLRQAGAFPVVVAPADGPLRKELVKEGIVVIIDESIRDNHFLFERFARNFDLAVVNTIDMAPVVRQLSAIPILRTVWWLHEAQMLPSRFEKLPGVNWRNVQVVCVSDYARRFVPSGIAAGVLPNGIPDQYVEAPPRNPAAPLTFVLSGTIEPRKGQDILVDAVAMLPPTVRAQCRFVLTGRLWEMHQGFWDAIQAKMASLPEIEYRGVVDHRTQLELIAAADVVLCCSRDEPASLVVMEAAMLSRPSIVSDHVGVRDLLDEGACRVFASGDAASLAAGIQGAFEGRDGLAAAGAAARRSYDRNFTLDGFGRRFMALCAEQIAAGEGSIGDAAA